LVRYRQKLQKLRTRIYMDLNYIDPQTKVLNYCYKWYKRMHLRSGDFQFKNVFGRILVVVMLSHS